MANSQEELGEKQEKEKKNKIVCSSCGKLFIKFREGSPYTNSCIICIQKTCPNLTIDDIQAIFRSQKSIMEQKRKKKKKNIAEFF